MSMPGNSEGVASLTIIWTPYNYELIQKLARTVWWANTRGRKANLPKAAFGQKIFFEI